jgi:surface antigen
MKKTTYQFLSPLLVVSSLLVLGSVSPSHAKAGMVNINSTPEATISTIPTPSKNKIDSEQEPLLPTEWTIDLPIHSEKYSETNYAYKQCTWWVYNRAKEFGIHFSTSMGNGGEWQNNLAYEITTTPKLHSAVSFRPGQIVGGQWQADPTYGHVAFVESIHPDGSILISQSGIGFSTLYNYQVLTASEAAQLHYVIGK